QKDREIYCKLFVGNLKFSTTTDDLKEFYSKFGEIVDCVVMKDGTGKSRGFGFVTYQDPDSVDEAQKNRPHYIGGRKTEPKRAIPRGEADKPEAQQNINKIFIGGLLEEVNEPELEDYFSKYGKVVNTNVIRDNVTGKKRGFSYLTFEDYDTVDKIVLEKYHTIHGKTSEVRKALSKEEMKVHQRKTFRRRYDDRGDDDYRGGGGGNNMMMPGNFLGGPMGGGMMDDLSSNGMMMGGTTPFDMLANMGMMSTMMGNMMGMGNNPMASMMGMGQGANGNPNSFNGGGGTGQNMNALQGGQMGAVQPMGGQMGNLQGMGGQMGTGQNMGGQMNGTGGNMPDGNAASAMMSGMMGMMGTGMNDGGMGSFNSGFNNSNFPRNQSQGFANMAGPMRGRSNTAFRNKPYNSDGPRGGNDRGFSAKRGGRF
ncbi:unnamed protein product, partial [Gordionus sp. m RMFG-2023]